MGLELTFGGGVARRVVRGGESAWAEASGEERCVDSECGPSRSWESLSTVNSGHGGVQECREQGCYSQLTNTVRVLRRGWQ